MNTIWPHDLDLWPMTLIYDFDLDILPLDQHAKIKVCMSVRSVVRVVTHRQTDKQTDNVKTITPIMCNKYLDLAMLLHLANHTAHESWPTIWVLALISTLSGNCYIYWFFLSELYTGQNRRFQHGGGSWRSQPTSTGGCRKKETVINHILLVHVAQFIEHLSDQLCEQDCITSLTFCLSAWFVTISILAMS